MISLLLALGAAPFQESPKPPRLVVMIAVDQMVPEHMHRLAPWFTGGFKRFVDQGMVFELAALEHGDTETAPGHTTYGTGMFPTHHGIVGNDWWPVDSKRAVYCFADDQSHPLRTDGAADGDSVSPKNLRVKGIADYVEAANAASHTLAISSKDRAAIGMSGQHPDLALWWSRSRGGFASSTWYASELPSWVREWNTGWVGAFRSGPFAPQWKCAFPEHFAGSGTAPDERDGEPGREGERSFPHGVPPLSESPSDKELARLAAWVYDGPCGDLFVLELARKAVDALELGQDDAPDLLMLSLSSCDTVGHSYGPLSCEVTDVLLRADRELGKLFDLLDQKVGRERWIASLSADHGVLELPESLATKGVPAERVSGKLVGESIKAARAAVEERFGKDFYLTGGSRGLRLSLADMQAANVDPAQVRGAYAESLRKAEWVEHALTYDELRAIARDGKAATGLARMEANSFDEERSPDLVLLCKPWKLVGLPFGTTHGTPYPYDRAIPLWFVGPGFPHGASFERAGSFDALPTLLRHAKIAVPDGLDGRVLVE